MQTRFSPFQFRQANIHTGKFGCS